MQAIDNWGFLFAGELTNSGATHTVVTGYSTTGQQFSYRTSTISALCGPFRLVGAYSNTGLIHLLMAGTVTNASNSLGSALYRSTDLGSSWQAVVGPWNSNSVIRVTGDTNASPWPGSNSVVVTTANGIFTSAQGPLPLILTNQMRAGFPIGIFATNVLIGQAGTPFQFQIAASNQPFYLGASNLPLGLTVNSNGLISGTVTNSRTNQAFLVASNLFGGTSLPVTFAFGLPPYADSRNPTNLSLALGRSFQTNFYFLGGVSNLAITNLPAGLNKSVFAPGGWIQVIGMPTTKSTNVVQMVGSNLYGVFTSTVTMRVGAVPSISMTGWTSPQSMAMSWPLLVGENPLGVSLTGLPPGLVFQSNTLSVSGIPDQAGSYPVTLRAWNEFGTNDMTVTAVILPVPVKNQVLYGTLAGMAGKPGSTDGRGADANFSSPRGVAADAAGNVYVADTGNHTIRKISVDGAVTTLAGAAGLAGSVDGNGSGARFFGPKALAVGADGMIYVADTENHLIRRISPAGEVTTLAGTAGLPGTQDGIGTAARFYRPMGMAVDASGNVYVADTGNHTIRKITPDGQVTRLAGQPRSSGFADGGPAVSRLNSPMGLVAAGDGSVWVADSNNFLLRKLLGTTLSTVAGSPGQGGMVEGVGSAARLSGPVGLALDAAGNVYFSEPGVQVLRKCTPSGEVSRWAGSLSSPGVSDGGYDEVKFYRPMGLALDSSGNLYVADEGNHAIRIGRAAPVNPVLASLRPRWVTESTLPVPVADLMLEGDPAGVTATASQGFEVRPTDQPGRFEVWTSGACDYEGSLFVTFQVALSRSGGTSTTLSGLLVMQDDRNEDADGDGIPEWQEEDGYGISDLKKDTDGDGVNDPVELADGTDPKNSVSFNRLNQGLIAYYAFSGNAQDLSGGGNSGQVIDCAFGEDRKGLVNQALRLDQAGSRVVVPSSENLQIGISDLTLTAWIRCDGSMVDRYFISKYYGSGAGYGLGTGQNGGPYAFLGKEASNALDWRGGTDINDGGWHFVAATYDRDGRLRIFVDGMPVPVAGGDASGVALGAYSGDIQTSAPLLIGRHEGGSSFQGWIDEVRIYRRALDPADVGELYLRDAGNLDQDGDGLTDAWEQGYGRYQTVAGDWTWAQAREDAKTKGGHLATLTTARENRFVMEMLGLNFPVGQYGWWVGGTGGADPWSWITGEAWAYENWHPRGEPNNPRDRNYFLLLQPDGSWDDWEGRIGYLLEFGYPTDPFKADTDGDGFNDHDETVAGTDPNDAAENPDFRQPFIVAQPQSITAAAGSSATFMVHALAPGPNILRNSNFEESTNFWNANGGQIQTTPGGYTGGNSLQLTANGGYGRLRYAQDLAMEAGVPYLATALGRGGYPTSNHSFDLWIGLLGGDTQMAYQELPRLEYSRNGFTWSTVRTLATSPSGALRSLNLLHFSPFGESSQMVDLVQWRRCGSEGLTYQWKKDGENISGANGPQLNFATLQSGQAGSYQVVVSSPYGSVTSDIATLQVGLDPAGDEDGDGLTNGQELTLGTNPYQKDTDGDGVNDPVEIADNTDPNSASSYNHFSQGLVGYYDAESLRDRAANLTALSPKGSVSLPVQSNGVRGKAFTLDGEDDGYIFPDLDSLKLDSFSIGAWFYWKGQTGRVNQILFRGGYDGGNDPFIMVINPGDDRLMVKINHDSGKDSLLMSPDILQSNRWNFAMATLDSSSRKFRLYLNGALVAETTASHLMEKDLAPWADPGWGIGNHSGNNFYNFPFNGNIDEVRFYSRALTSVEVGQLYVRDAGNLDQDGDGLTDAWERGFGRYQIVGGNFTWDQAKVDAEVKGGHLVTITSPKEWEFVESSLLSDPHGNYWMGGREISNQWSWVTGENWSFTKWWWSEPNGNPNDVLLVPFTTLGAGNNWYDHDPAPLPNDAFYSSGYLVEFGYPTDPTKADTDGDGFDDKAESLAGTDPNDARVFPNPQWDWSFGFSHINEAGAETFLTSTANVRKYSEWQSPPLTYWGPTANGVDGSLTYRFPATQPILAARLKAGTDTYNFPWPGYFGSGKGWSSIWGSKNGVDWVLLMDNPRPTDNVGRWMAYDALLPQELLGATELWIQVRLSVTEAPNSSYTTAQFGRGSSANSQRIFEVKLDYDGFIPEFAQASAGISPTAMLNLALGYSTSLDSDGDGQADGAELVAGTDPNNPNSRLTLSLDTTAAPMVKAQSAGSEPSGSGQVIFLTWSSVPGKIYEVQKSTDLGNWGVVTQVEGEPAPATQTRVQISSPDPKAFYRVRIVQ